MVGAGRGVVQHELDADLTDDCRWARLDGRTGTRHPIGSRAAHPANVSTHVNILTRGGTILGTSRTPFSQMRGPNSQGFDKIDEKKRNYKQMKLDCLVTLGGNGTHKTAALLAEEGLNVIGLPKTIDNDIAGTDFTFGFHTAVEIATDVVDRIRELNKLDTTAVRAGQTLLWAALDTTQPLANFCC